MRLQIKPGGAWRDVVEFEPEQLRAVQEAVVVLAQALGRQKSRGLDQAEWRITKVNPAAARSPKVVAYLEPVKSFSWRKR